MYCLCRLRIEVSAVEELPASMLEYIGCPPCSVNCKLCMYCEDAKKRLRESNIKQQNPEVYHSNLIECRLSVSRRDMSLYAMNRGLRGYWEAAYH